MSSIIVRRKDKPDAMFSKR